MAKASRAFLPAALVALISAMPVVAQQAPTAPAQQQRAPAPEKADVTELLKPGPLPENIMGKADAPVTIIEYASLTCPHCATFHTQSLPHLKATYIDTGKVRLIFRDFPFDIVAMGGTMLSRCAPKEKFFDMTDVLFREQQKWAFSDDPEKNLREIALKNGFTQESFDACLQRQDIYDGVIEVRKRAHEAFKVDSTPTLFVNGAMHRGVLSPAQLDAAITPLLPK